MQYITNPLSYKFIKNKFLESNIPYNKESLYYFSNKKIVQINNNLVNKFNSASEEIMDMISSILEDFKKGDYLELYEFDDSLNYQIIKSFNKDLLAIRLDWGIENNQPKLFEINAESCGFLTECSLIPRWLNEHNIKSLDLNLYENYSKKLIHNIADNDKIFMGSLDYIYDIQNLHWIKSFIKDYEIEIVNLNEIEEKENYYFYKCEKIRNLHKIYPWEWILEDTENKIFQNINLTEPLWTILFNSKIILYILFKKYKNNSLLLETYYNEKVKGKYIEKNMNGTQGSGVKKSNGTPLWKKSILQRRINPIIIEKDILIFSSWIINQKFNGMGIKTDNKLISNDNHKFIPFSIE